MCYYVDNLIYHTIVTCEDVDLILLSSPRHEFVGYHDPAVEGTSANFICPLGQTLTGPNSSMCMENGEWVPDPSEVGCRGNIEHNVMITQPSSFCTTHTQ